MKIIALDEMPYVANHLAVHHQTITIGKKYQSISKN